jgi:hypothetical protein
MNSFLNLVASTSIMFQPFQRNSLEKQCSIVLINPINHNKYSRGRLIHSPISPVQVNTETTISLTSPLCTGPFVFSRDQAFQRYDSASVMSREKWEYLLYCNRKALTPLRGSLIDIERTNATQLKIEGENDSNKATVPGGEDGRSPEDTS